MREILTALAIVLIVALTAALAGPYFVDWNASRGFLEAKLSHALGQKVTIGGAIDLKLLPTPYLILDQAVIGGDDGPISMGIRHLHLELSVAPLLHGEFEIVEARLAEPTIRVTLQRDRTLPPLPSAPALDADVRFDRIAVSDGTLAIADPESGRTFALDHLDLEAEAESLTGPFKGSGAAGSSTARTKFRFASSGAQNGTTRTKLVVEETPHHAGLDLDGAVSLARGSAGDFNPSFNGTVAVSGHARSAAFDRLPWRLSGSTHADAHQARLQAGELRVGSDEHSLLLAASGEADLGDMPALRLDLAGKQLDVDRLSASADSGGGPAPMPDLFDLRGSLETPLPTTIRVTAATATYGGATLSNLDAAFVLGSTRAEPLRFSGDGPGRSHLALDGTAAAGPEPSFSGKIALAAPDVPTLASWLTRVAPGASWPALPFRSADAQGDVRLDAAGLVMSGLAVRVDRSSVTGSMHYAAAQTERPASLAADLHAAALDLDVLPDFEAMRTATAAADLDLRLEARAIRVGRVGTAAVDTGRISVALTKSASRFALNAFRIEGLGGATIEASATIDPAGGHLDARIDAGKLADAATLFRRVAPGAWSDALVARAGVLGPAKLMVSAVLKPLDAAGSALPRAVTVTGTLGATSVNATLAPDQADDRKIVASASATAPEGSVLLRQIGIPTLPLNTLGVSRVTFEARGPPDGSLATTVHGAFEGTTLDYTGHIATADAAATGTLTLASHDLSPLLQSTALAFPDLSGHLPADLSARLAWTQAGLSLTDIKARTGAVATSGSLMWHPGAKTALTGTLTLDHLAMATLLGLALGPDRKPAANSRWSAAGFGAGLIDPPSAALDIRTRTLDLGAGLTGTDASLGLNLSQGLVSLSALKATVAGGALDADLRLRRDGATAALEGALTLSKVAVALPSASGRLSAHLDLAASGRSASTLVASLAGTGSATMEDLRIPHADPAALPRIFDEIEADRLTVDDDSVLRALDQEGAAALVTATQPFALNLAAGILHFDPKADTPAGAAAPVRSSVSASLDVSRLAIDGRVEQTLQALPKTWAGPPPQIVTLFSGPLETATRTVDVSAFLNALASRALARESARIEAYEFDARERAFFSQRLQADRRREQERLKAEEEVRLAVEAARKAEAERRAREVAARLERVRKTEEAVRAAERAAQEKAARDRTPAEQQPRERTAPRDQRQSSDEAPARVDQPAFRAPNTPTDPAAAGRY